jgi:aspartyl-tRNA(Asn)/glutamyl-tRNA(Gln) amidotransferase subunit C
MITKAELEKVARLARLGLNSEEIENLAIDIEKIINYFQTLKELPLENILPMTHSIEKTLELRPDTVQENLMSYEVLPYLKFHYFYVPQVIEESV